MSEGTRARKGARKKPRTADAPDAAAEPFAGLPFEDALSRLEGLVDRLEEGDLDLAEALSHFEEGVQLTRHCTAQLEAAERRIELLTRESGDWATRPFAGAESGSLDAGGDDADDADEDDDT